MAKRGNNEGSISKRSDGRWMARVSLGNGQRKAFYGATRDEVARKLASALRDRDAGLPAPSDRQTVGQYLSHWLEHSVKSSVRPRTYESYAMQVRVHIMPELGAVRLTQLTPQHVQALLHRKSDAGLSARSVGYVHAVLRIALGRAEKWGLVARNVASLVDPPRGSRREVQPLTPTEATAFLSAIKGHAFEPLFVLALATGLRQGEALGLRWGDVDLTAGTLTVRHALQRIDGKVQLVEPKTAKSRRTIALPRSVTAQLVAHRARQQEAAKLTGRPVTASDFVFTSSIGTPLDARRVTKVFQKILADEGLPRRRFHDLRHTCATFLLLQGVNPRVVMDTLGHSEIAMTLNTYSHVLPVLKRDAADRMEEMLRRP